MIDPVEVQEELSPRSRAKREQIIQAAQHLFLQDGFERTSMEAIRIEAQVSKPTLYNHFDSKENLFIGICEYALEDLSAAWGPVTVEKITITSQEQLRAMLFQFAVAARDHLMVPHTISLARTLLAEVRTFPELGRTFRERISLRVIKMVSMLLAAAAEQGVVYLEPEKIPLAARFFAGQLLSYLLIDGLLLGDNAPEPPTTEELVMVIDLYLRMIC